MFRPVLVGVELVDEDGSVLAPVTDLVGLFVAVDVAVTDIDRPRHRPLPHCRANGSSFPLDVPRPSDVDRDQPADRDRIPDG